MLYDTSKVKYMELQDLLEEYKPAYCENWEEWFLAANPSNGSETGKLVERLCNELETNRSFAHPIHLGSYDENDPEDEKQIANGMHRIAAHHYSSINTVKVIEYKDLPKNSKIYTPMLEVECYIKDNNSKGIVSDELYDDIHEFFSFRLNSDEWVECEGISGSNIILITTSELYTVELLEEVYEKIEKMLEDSVYKDLIEIECVAVKLYKWGQFDD